jgi:acylphosphatase
MEDIARRIVFSGRVQGVGFRFTAMNIANRYGLVGTVRNLPDGRVEMLAQGHPEDIEDCLRDLRESFTGPISAEQSESVEPSPSRSRFRIDF